MDKELVLKQNYNQIKEQLNNILFDINDLESMFLTLKKDMKETVIVDKSIVRASNYDNCNKEINNIKNVIREQINIINDKL